MADFQIPSYARNPYDAYDKYGGVPNYALRDGLTSNPLIPSMNGMRPSPYSLLDMPASMPATFGGMPDMMGMGGMNLPHHLSSVPTGNILGMMGMDNHAPDMGMMNGMKPSPDHQGLLQNALGSLTNADSELGDVDSFQDKIQETFARYQPMLKTWGFKDMSEFAKASPQEIVDRLQNKIAFQIKSRQAQQDAEPELPALQKMRALFKEKLDSMDKMATEAVNNIR